VPLTSGTEAGIPKENHIALFKHPIPFLVTTVEQYHKAYTLLSSHHMHFRTVNSMANNLVSTVVVIANSMWVDAKMEILGTHVITLVTDTVNNNNGKYYQCILISLPFSAGS